MADITDVPTFFRLITLKLVVFIDVYSRFPLAFQVFWQEPSGPQMVELFRKAVERFKLPKYFLSDQGGQFKEGAFPEELEILSVDQRFGALGTHGSIAIIERLWRTAKDALDLRVLCRPLGRGHLEEMIDRFLFHYATIRPHQTFGGATPAERYFRIEPPTIHAVRAPRAGSTDGAAPGPFRILFLDRDRRLPVVLLEILAA